MSRIREIIRRKYYTWAVYKIAIFCLCYSLFLLKSAFTCSTTCVTICLCLSFNLLTKCPLNACFIRRIIGNTKSTNKQYNTNFYMDPHENDHMIIMIMTIMIRHNPPESWHWQYIIHYYDNIL